jgi:hypothetical protein
VSLASRLRSLVAAVVWLAIAVVIAAGIAGIAATMNRTPGTAAREELTWIGDREAEPALDDATVELQALSDRVDDLGSTAREALAHVTSGDLDALQAAITTGTLQLDAVDAATTDLRVALVAIPHSGEDWALHVSPEERQRYDGLEKTAGLTVGLEDSWAAFTGRALDAATMKSLLALHDEQTATAAAAGTKGSYREALDRLAESDATIARARTLRDGLAKTSDVSTLTTWIDRNADYDAALRRLYRALIESKGRVTAPVRQAFDDERAARSLLPADSQAVVVIMSDIAQGGLNQAVIKIEEARGALSEALDTQEQLQAPESPAPG